MQRIFTTLLLTGALLFALALPATADGHDLSGVSVQVDNTIESQAFDFPTETPFGSQGPVTIGDSVEFAECCDGFYEVDIAGTQITMRWIGDESFARVIEPGTFDRYYFTFGSPVLADADLNAATTLPATLTVASPTELVVEIGPGLEVGDGFDAVIDLSLTETELAVTGTSSWVLAIAGITAVVAGAILVSCSRSTRQLGSYT